ncbi:hypothetical protein PSHT_06819, partial [Puccinia striiformis]
MVPAGSHILSGLAQGLLSQGLNSHALNSSIVLPCHSPLKAFTTPLLQTILLLLIISLPLAIQLPPSVQSNLQMMPWGSMLQWILRANVPQQTIMLFDDQSETVSYLISSLIIWTILTGSTAPRAGIKTRNMIPKLMASMVFYHQFEGFSVIASLHPKGAIFKQGGSSFGNCYLNMIASKNGRDAHAEFHIWVAVQAIQIENGCQPTEIKQQRIKAVSDITNKFLANKVADNIHKIRVKLKELINEFLAHIPSSCSGISSGNKLSCVWPGENCEKRLKQMKLSLEIDKNKDGLDQTVLACLSLNKIHLAYHSDWEAPPPKSKNPDKGKHSSKRNSKRNSSTCPAPNTSNSNASDCAAAATASNTSDTSATDHPTGAPNTSNSDCAAAAPNTSKSSAPKKRKRPAPNTSNSTALDRAAAPHAPNWAAAACNNCDSNSSNGAAADKPNSNNTSVSGPSNFEGSTSSRCEPIPVLDPILEALGHFCIEVTTLNKIKHISARLIARRISNFLFSLCFCLIILFPLIVIVLISP